MKTSQKLHSSIFLLLQGDEALHFLFVAYEEYGRKYYRIELHHSGGVTRNSPFFSVSD
jgi:hypothetical protein